MDDCQEPLFCLIKEPLNYILASVDTVELLKRQYIAEP